MAQETQRCSGNLTGARIFCFRYKPDGSLQKVQSDSQRKALTRIVTQFYPDTQRYDWELVWEYTEERVYGKESTCQS